MIKKISAVLAAALILGSASVASAATAQKVGHHYFRAPRGQLMLLENARAHVPAASAVHNFQNNWNVSY
jgi:hypothetical protein